MRFTIPMGTFVQQQGCRVVIVFRNEARADAFCEWIRWMNDAPDGTEMVINKDPEPKPI